MFLFEIEKMHRQYGPIVRITPCEVHVSDPAFYDEIYAPSSRKRDKPVSFVPSIGLPDSMAATVGHEQHRFRRSILTEFFSRRSVLALSDMVDERLQTLMQRFEEFRNNQTVVCLDDAFTALTSDIITSYCCGRHWGFVEDEHFNNQVRKAIEDLAKFCHVNRFFPWLVYLPRILSPRERTRNRLRDEAVAVIGAGTESTGHILTVAAYHLARNSDMRATLRTELKQVLPTLDSRPTLPELEKLPYLVGVVNESLRLSYALVGRLPRVAPTESLTYKDYVIPPGTPMSSSSYFIHRDASIFPDPERFDPDRWATAVQKEQNCKRYLTSFTRGSRACLGINLAYLELFQTIAHFVRRFDVHLYDTEPEDVRLTRDMTIGYTRRGFMKVYAKLSSAEEWSGVERCS
ncbi:cytochrome p450 domain-containing protein [Hirsutella rhossiliensis]|uniref:Cytochrome p450 domain-containing protein n=1 Tax=Hirsutella rhossiliensis TaxID=111463 RepID=A0A9P8MZT6_9HYPO|nr:cytochrome p450 domain-containing protein [Hirsutella rhossiliensis]KAH0964254.1 cytochrome p450 domain-containing protein [Hirsutella rhossiliensis]